MKRVSDKNTPDYRLVKKKILLNNSLKKIEIKQILGGQLTILQKETLVSTVILKTVYTIGF